MQCDRQTTRWPPWVGHPSAGLADADEVISSGGTPGGTAARSSRRLTLARRAQRHVRGRRSKWSRSRRARVPYRCKGGSPADRGRALAWNMTSIPPTGASSSIVLVTTHAGRRHPSDITITKPVTDPLAIHDVIVTHHRGPRSPPSSQQPTTTTSTVDYGTADAHEAGTVEDTDLRHVPQRARFESLAPDTTYPITIVTSTDGDEQQGLDDGRRPSAPEPQPVDHDRHIVRDEQVVRQPARAQRLANVLGSVSDDDGGVCRSPGAELNSRSPARPEGRRFQPLRWRARACSDCSVEVDVDDFGRRDTVELRATDQGGAVNRASPCPANFSMLARSPCPTPLTQPQVKFGNIAHVSDGL